MYDVVEAFLQYIYIYIYILINYKINDVTLYLITLYILLAYVVIYSLFSLTSSKTNANSTKDKGPLRIK